MTRVREEALSHGTREGLSRALGATGPVITSAGILDRPMLVPWA